MSFLCSNRLDHSLTKATRAGTVAGMVPGQAKRGRVKREHGSGVGISRPSRDCPRNCRRRATPGTTGPRRSGRWGELRPASQETCHRTNHRPGRGVRKEHAMKTSMRRPLAMPSCFVAQSAAVLRSCPVARVSHLRMQGCLASALAALATRRGAVLR